MKSDCIQKVCNALNFVYVNVFHLFSFIKHYLFPLNSGLWAWFLEKNDETLGDREQILLNLKNKMDKFEIMDMGLMTSFLVNLGDGVELPSFPVCKVETLHSRFQDVVEAVKNKTKSFSKVKMETFRLFCSI